MKQLDLFPETKPNKYMVYVDRHVYREHWADIYRVAPTNEGGMLFDDAKLQLVTLLENEIDYIRTITEDLWINSDD